MTDSPCVETPPPLTLRLLGPCEVLVGDAPLRRLRNRKGLWLLALLILRHPRPVSRPWLAGTLWTDSSETFALRNLRTVLSELRSALGPAASRIVSPCRSTLVLDLGDSEVDLITFDEAVKRGGEEALERAAALYRGPLLEGCYEEWVEPERRARERAYLNVLKRLAQMAGAAGDRPAELGHLRRWRAAEPLNEGAARDLMKALAAAGEHGEATAIYRDVRETLHRELNAPPSPETRTAYERIRAEGRDAARRPSGVLPAPLFPAGEDPSRPSFPLPHPRTKLIGREKELGEIARLLSGTRLLTVTGSGGVGKTRAALQVAADRREDYSHGAVFADLAPLSDPALVPGVVAEAARVKEEPGRPLVASLSSALRDRELLLVLDNCEHLLDACARLVDALLGNCPGVTLLATSREPLGTAGETTYRLPSLDAPDPLRPPRLEELGRYDAVRLFLDRAADAQPSFAATEANASAVALICHELGGIPLALELAAAWVRALPVDEIARRLDDRFRLLTGGSRTALPRHRTLRATMDWSYGLLTEAEQTLLRRLSVFAGGWTLEAAEAVCSGEGIEKGEVLDRLAALVEKSLALFQEGETEARYRLLETVRQYAREKLTEAGAAEGGERRHRDFYLSLAEDADRGLYGPEQVACQERLEDDHANLRAALDWSLAEEGGDAALRLVAALYFFWVRGNHLREGREWTTRALAKGRNASPLVLARALVGGHDFELWAGDYATAASLAEEGLQWARQAQEGLAISHALFCLALAEVNRGELKVALPLAEEGLALAQAEGDRWLTGRHLVIWGLVAWMKGDYAASRPYFRETLEISRELGDEWHIAMTLANLGFVTRGDGDPEEAWALHREGVPLCRRLNDRRGVAWHLVGMAGLEVSRGGPSRAVRLLGAATAGLEAMGSVLPPSVREEQSRTLDQTRALLDEDDFAAAWDQGRAMTLEDAIAFALEKPE